MSTILKDTEAIAGLPEGAAARPAAGSADSGAKPQPVALEVSVTVNGARTVEGSEKREPFSESTKTVLVFGNGAVIRLQAPVAPGQLLFLTNEKTKKEVVCQVVKSKNYRNISGYVELEFTEAVVGFWGMRFPGDRVAGPAGTPNVVQATPATGSPLAPQIAAVPTTPVSSVAPVAAPTEARLSAPVTPAIAETPATIAPPVKTTSPAATTAAPGMPTAKAPAVPAAPTAPLVMKTDFTVSSSAPKTVLPLTGTLSLPRAAEAKPVALAAVAPKIPAPIAPAATSPAAPAHAEPVKSAAELSAESLRAENARLQEQLAALLNPPKNNPAPVAPVSSAPISSAPVAEIAKPAPPVAAKVVEIAKPQVAKPEAAAPPAKPDSWLPDLAAMLAKDVQASRDAVAPAQTHAPATLVAALTPETPSAPKPVAVAPASISTASLQSLLDQEQVKIPSWLEPLARNSGSTAAAHDNDSNGTVADAAAPSHADAELHDELDDVFEHRSDDLSDTLVKTDEGEAAEGHGSGESAENVAVPTFGARLGIDESGSTEGAGKGKLLAIAALILVAVAGGGYWYTQQGGAVSTGNRQSAVVTKPQAQAPARLSDAAPETNQAAARTTPGALGTVSPAGAIKNQAATPVPVNANLVVEKTRAAQPGNASPVSSATNPAQPFANVQQVTAPKHASLGDVHLAAPNVTRKNDGGAISDADVSMGSTENSESAPAVSGFINASGPAAPAMPVAVGGSVTTAKLLKSVPPVYPAFAKTQRVSGDVKIDALIDVSGQVTTMKIVSGPTPLHQAAMDALRQWKYQPANLDGKAVPIHLTVTIQFRMQ